MKTYWMLLLFPCLAAVAAETTTNLTITADTFEFAADTRVATYTGNVVVIDPPTKTNDVATRITCGKLIVKLPVAGSRIENITAEENVVIEQGENQARGAKAVYQAETDIVELTGNPVLLTAQGTLWGEVVIFDRARNRLSARGSKAGRIRMELKPGSVGQPTQGLLPGKPKPAID